MSTGEQAYLVVALLAIVLAAFLILDGIVVLTLWVAGELRAKRARINAPNVGLSHLRIDPVPGCLTCEAASCVSAQALARHKVADHGSAFA